MAEAASQATVYLTAHLDGDPLAAEKLLPLVYDQLRALAARHMKKERMEHTLQPTALVHEAYMRLFRRQDVDWQDRAHFFNAAARAMREILIEQARKHATAKRGGNRKRVSLDEAFVSVETQADDLIALDEALQDLETGDRPSAEIVMLRYFAGLTVDQTAQAMEISAATVDRQWRYARAWLRRRIEGGSGRCEEDRGDER